MIYRNGFGNILTAIRSIGPASGRFNDEPRPFDRGGLPADGGDTRDIECRAILNSRIGHRRR